MSSDSEEIVQEIRQEFELMLKNVQSSEEETAYEVERSLFRQLLEMGYRLMILFLIVRAENYPHTAIKNKKGEEIPYGRTTLELGQRK